MSPPVKITIGGNDMVMVSPNQVLKSPPPLVNNVNRQSRLADMLMSNNVKDEGPPVLQSQVLPSMPPRLLPHTQGPISSQPPRAAPLAQKSISVIHQKPPSPVTIGKHFNRKIRVIHIFCVIFCFIAHLSKDGLNNWL